MLNPRDPKGSLDLTVWVGVEGQTSEQMVKQNVLKQSYGHPVLETGRMWEGREQTQKASRRSQYPK